MPGKNSNSSFTVNDATTKKVIADFLEMGHVDNIIAMFRQDPGLYDWSGDLLDDDRFMVRMGMVVLFESLVATEGQEVVARAIPALTPLLKPTVAAYVRGEAATILGIIGTPAALALLRPLLLDEDHQVVTIVQDFLQDTPGAVLPV